MTKHIILLILALLISSQALRAGIDDLPVTIVDGRSYHYYDVEPKQTIYSICRELGISKAQLIEANPEVGTDGLKAYQRLLFPVAEVAAAASGPAERPTHLVKKRETIYGLSRLYGVTPAQLEEWNPGIREGLREGDIIFVAPPVESAPEGPRVVIPDVLQSIPTEMPTHPKAAPADDGPELYTVRSRETFYSIAHSHGISVAELEEANPGVSILREGDTLRIPRSKKVAQATPATPTVPATPVAPPVAAPAPQPDTIGSSPATPAGTIISNPAGTDINIAVVLPFMLDSEQRPRRAELMTEWYKGFLLAIDSLRHSSRPIHIQTFDTRGSDATLTDIIRNPALARAQVIIAPDNAAHLDRLAEFGADHGIDVMNLFVVADRNYARNPSLFQATIPHDAMYDAAVKAIADNVEGEMTPVILLPKDGKADKQNFIDLLTASFSRRSIPYKTISYEGTLKADDLASLDPDGRYAFIPNTASQADLNRILPALIDLKLSMTALDPIRLYGYPEWTTFRGETLTNMHTLNTYAYSRFFTSPDDPWARQVEEAFGRWYGSPMAAAVPRQGLLGFDTGMFLITSLRSGGSLAESPVYHGVQNAFRFVRPTGIKGHVNDDLYFVNFRPSGLTDRISL